MNGSTVQKYVVPLAGGLQAVYNGSGLQYYRHADWLGSNRFSATPAGTVYYDGAYAPFGENYAEMGTTDRSFTGQTQDIVSGLYDFTFRQQSSAQGRWLVPDPAGLAAVDITNPQTWNRYAYVGNNPLMRIDPLGLDDYTISVDAWGDGGGDDGGDEGTGPETSTLYDGSFQYGCSTVVDGLCQDFNFTLVSNVSDRFGGGKGKFHLTNPFKQAAKSVVCTLASPIIQLANLTNGVVGVGGGGGGAVGFIFGIAGSFGAQVVADPNGNVGLITTASLNPGIPPVVAAGGNAGFQVSYTRTKSISNLQGYSGVVSVGGGPYSIDISGSSNGTFGATFTGGVGIGARFSGSNALGSTVLWTSTNCGSGSGG